MISRTEPVPVFGRDGEPCPACGAPLAGDQRYCLHCGARRPEARLEFLDVLDADVRARSVMPVTAAAVVTSEPRGLNGRLQAHAGLLALTALMLLTLTIGLLLGHWATDGRTAPAAATSAPQVIRVEGTAAPTATTAADAGGSDGDASPSGASAKDAKAAGKHPASSTSTDKAKAPKGSVSVTSLKSKKAVDDAVKKGKPISTGTGTLPPKDDKPAGGGSSFEEIG